MAKRVFTSVLLVVFLLTLSASFSSARLFNGVNLVLPSADRVSGAADTVTAGRVRSSAMRLRAVALRRRARKYGPLVLNMLPKGGVPPSGPSKGTNNVNN
ncbi:uncharacterized protein LOC114735338 [Neltuma alba]|uniref:uncharacterized protein LOC114735338 n=1 Tax=Neltuma alba TaxID=207710 RepID=UPI0010A31F28|nr:uncharacterized protein LOC114735338 [Prosopis alba]